MEAFEMTGKIKVINSTEYFDSGFSKRSFVITTDEKYQQDIIMELIKDKCDALDAYNVGDEVRCKFNIRGRYWVEKDRYFVNLTCWWMEKISSSIVTKEIAEAADKAVDEHMAKVDEATSEQLPF